MLIASISNNLRILCFLTIGAGLLTGCGGEQDQSTDELNVILISIDTLRADHLGCYGHPRIKTPNIDRLAAEGVLFEQCTATAPVTLPSHTSLLTGTYPFVHKVRDNGTFRLHEANLTIAEVFKQAGYATAAQVAAFVLNHGFGLDQGFDAYRDVGFTAATEAGQRNETEIPAEQVTDSTLELLHGVAGRPFFMFVHYFDAHQPYQAPQRFAEQYINPYPAEIAYVDEQIGRLLAGLDAAGLRKKTLIVLTADHGEGLGQHKEATHAYFVYDTTLAVPLIFRCPGKLPAGKRIAEQVRSIDIAPTILALLKMPPLSDAQGVDLVQVMRGKAAIPALAAYSETFYTKYNLGFSQLRSLRADGWKYIHGPRPELYHLDKDPLEAHDLADAQPARVAKMRALMRQLLEQAPCVVTAAQAQRPVSTQDLRNLESLGYVGGPAPSSVPTNKSELDLFEPEGPNPMDHTREIQLTSNAVGLSQTGQHHKIEQAIRALLKEVGHRSDKFVWAHAHLAGALAAQGKLEEALQHFDLAIAGRPEDGQMYTMKGMVLRALRRDDQALIMFEQAAALEPVFAQTHLNLAVAYASQQRNAEALAQFRLAIKKEPKMVRAYAALAGLLARLGHGDEAVTVLDQALTEIEPTGDEQTATELRNLRKRYQP